MYINDPQIVVSLNTLKMKTRETTWSVYMIVYCDKMFFTLEFNNQTLIKHILVGDGGLI